MCSTVTKMNGRVFDLSLAVGRVFDLSLAVGRVFDCY